MLLERYDREFLRARLVPRDAWQPFPRASDRAAWDALAAHPLNRQREAYVVGKAEALLGRPWPVLPATLYMEYVRNGNRSRYQAAYFQRRADVVALALAECFEGKGRFLDELANGVWAVSEEATWCVPAHAARLPGDVLHRQDVESLDLFACETGMLLALTHYLLGEALEGLSPALCDRMRRQVFGRIVGPFEAGDEFGRAGWLNGFNNWSPWCASNVLASAMLLLDDPERLADLTLRLMAVVDRFIARYGDDGGCDEGPGYWNEAAGALLVFLELLHSRTEGALDVYAEPKIAAMAHYIVAAHIDGPWFANFADAAARSGPHPAKVYRFGERVGSDALRCLALLSMRHWQPHGAVDPPLRIAGVSRPLLGPLMELFWIPPDAAPSPRPRERVVWLPDVQALFARESATPGEGLVLAAKGGHNAESHNHNDLGSFIIFLDGQPAIVDVGAPTYTRKTFSAERYDIWCIRASGHNVPLVNGVEQAPGREHRATHVAFHDDGGTLTLAMSLEEAYPEAAGLASLRREITFEPGPPAAVTVRDTFELREGPARVRVPLFAARPPEPLEPGRLAIGCGSRRLVLAFDPDVVTTSIEPIPLDDDRLRAAWGDAIYRIDVQWTGQANQGAYELRFSAVL